MPRRSPKAWLVAVPLLLALGVQPGSAQKPGTANRELDAIQKVLDRCIEIANDPKLNAAQRARLSNQLHRPDGTYKKEELPLYFGPSSNPVARGAQAYIGTVNTNIDWYRQQGYKFETRLGEAQISYDRNLAVVVATPTGVVTSPKGQVLGSSPARWTIVLQKAGDGRWYIVHEHLSFFGETKFTDDQLRRRLAGRKEG